ncbi:hypothetical protein EFA69_19520 [Rufibacter immobilis]|uniref:STAS/SEC14 domain-containing protein n=1 Tax=Rufibacter immobilis TaxID=1348778 RepID=A0A3M9MSS0_9BACT|nr:hypothetical protein [Rufibacter immobilis]RNI28255.1 hypothetical protein EFA69_19520 [Rufibacter immobilis]
MHIDLQLQPLHQDDYLKIEIDPHVSFIYLEWLKTPQNDTFRELFRMAVSLAVDLNSEYWLSDARTIPYLDFANQNWVIREVTPLLAASKLRKYARLSSKESIDLLDIHRIYETLSSQTNFTAITKFESFTSKEAAQEWLFSDYGEVHCS